MAAVQRDSDGQNWPTWTLWNLVRIDVKSCTWGGIIPFDNTAGGWMGWGEALLKRTCGCLGGRWHEPTACTGSKESKQHPGLWNTRWARRFKFPLYSVLVRSYLNTTCIFGLRIARRTLIRWRKFSGRPASWSGAPALILGLFRLEKTWLQVNLKQPPSA